MSLRVLPLYNDSFYSYTTIIENKTYTLKFLYNTKAEKWFMSIYDENVSPILESIAVLPFTLFPYSYDLPFKGFFYTQSDVPNARELYEESPRNMAKYFYLEYYE
jgi:hypothetical protein